MGIELWWLGQSGFRLRALAGGATLFVDPFLSPHEHRAWPAPISAEAMASEADLILCTHDHIDHFDRPALRAAAAVAGATFRLVVPAPLVVAAVALGLPRERVIGATPGEAIRVGGVTIWPVPARHGVHTVDAYTFGQALSGGAVRYLGFVIELGGVRVYHAGDTIPYHGQVERLRTSRPEVALVPINGRDYFREDLDLVGNCDPREAVQLAAAIGARVLVPMHWEMFPGNQGYPDHAVAYAVAHHPALSVLVPGRGARLRLDAADDA